LPAACLIGEHGSDLIAALQTWQPTLCLHFDPQAAQALTTGVQFRFIGFDAPAIQRWRNSSCSPPGPEAYGIGIAFNVDSGRLPRLHGGGDDCRCRMVLHLTEQRAGKGPQSWTGKHRASAQPGAQ
jgi:hypothetical protein